MELVEQTTRAQRIAPNADCQELTVIEHEALAPPALGSIIAGATAVDAALAVGVGAAGGDHLVAKAQSVRWERVRVSECG